MPAQRGLGTAPHHDDNLDTRTLFPIGATHPVGSPALSLGRNRACRSCRLRKGKCDGRKPICSPCLRSHAHALRKGKEVARHCVFDITAEDVGACFNRSSELPFAASISHAASPAPATYDDRNQALQVDNSGHVENNSNLAFTGQLPPEESNDKQSLLISGWHVYLPNPDLLRHLYVDWCHYFDRRLIHANSSSEWIHSSRGFRC